MERSQYTGKVFVFGAVQDKCPFSLDPVGPTLQFHFQKAFPCSRITDLIHIDKFVF